MELPKNASELLIWLAMQFPVVAVSALMARWALKYTERLHDKRNDDNQNQHAQLIAEKDRRLADRDRRIEEQSEEIKELKAKLTRSKKPGGGEQT